jgi:hypothetical protein
VQLAAHIATGALSSFSAAVGWMIAAGCGFVTFYYARRSRILGSVGGGCRTEQLG